MCPFIVCLKTITESVNFGHLNRKTVKEKTLQWAGAETTTK